MVRARPNGLAGVVELDATFAGAIESGGRRHLGKKTSVVTDARRATVRLADSGSECGAWGTRQPSPLGDPP